MESSVEVEASVEIKIVQRCNDPLIESGKETDGNVMMWLMERVTGLCGTYRVVAMTRVSEWKGVWVCNLVAS